MQSPPSLPLPELPNNLPERSRPHLIGRDDAVQAVFAALAQQRPDLVQLDGIGGIGKSAVALEVAWRIVKHDPTVPQELKDLGFKAVIYTTFQRRQLISHTITNCPVTSGDFDALCNAIASVLQFGAIQMADTSQRQAFTLQALRDHGPVLLIVDNLEDVTDSQVIQLLRDLPLGSNALLTTRLRRADAGSPDVDIVFRGTNVPLPPLHEHHMRAIIRRECEHHVLSLDPLLEEKLIRLAQGIPLAAIWPLRCAKVYGVIQAFRILSEHGHPANEVLRYIFANLFGQVQSDETIYHALIALTFFDEKAGATLEALAWVVDCDEEVCVRKLETLYELHLVDKDVMGRRFYLPSTTREYLVVWRAQPWEQEARERWVAYYRDEIAAKHGGLDWSGWADEYSELDREWLNLLKVGEWCMLTQRYDEAVALWDDDHVRQFANIWGRWNDRKQWLRSIAWALERDPNTSWPAAILMDYRSALAYTLIHQRLPHLLGEAKDILAGAWTLSQRPDFIAREGLAGVRAQLDVALNHVLLFIHQKEYPTAKTWLARYEKLLAHSGVTGRDYARRLVEIPYYHGWMHFEQREYAAARECFIDMEQRGAEIGYDRAVIFARNYLADVARIEGDWRLRQAALAATDAEAAVWMVKAQQSFETARAYLEKGEHNKECEKDRRRFAFYKRSHAYLACSLGSSRDAQTLAREALQYFARLGMEPDDLKTLQRLAQGKCPEPIAPAPQRAP